jgi:hypothetical protein
VLPTAAQSDGVLECTFARGVDLDTLPMQAKLLGFRLGESVELGRLCQPGFFENLLQGEPQRITQLSRKQCCVLLSKEESGALCFYVRNVGTNAVFVDGQKLERTCGRTISEGGTLGLAAAISGTHETRFLKLVEFMLKHGPSSREHRL